MTDAPRDVARRIEVAQAKGTVLTVGRLRDTYDDDRYGSEALAGGWLLFAPPDVPLWGGKALGFEPLDDPTIAHVEAAFFDRAMDAWIEICPLADKALDGRLAARGYVSKPSCQVYVRRAEAPFHRVASDIEVEPVDKTDDGAVDHFATTVASGFKGGKYPDDWNTTIASFAARTRDAYLARIDGETAGGGVVTIEDGLARFVCMSTLPAFRQRGVQRALMQVRLDCARARGADTIFVQCEPGSPTARNAERLGFRLAYEKTVRIRPRP